MKAGQVRKAAGAAVVGVYGWFQLIVTSAPPKPTATEWLALGGVVVTVAAVFGLTNDPPPAVDVPPVQGGQGTTR